MEAKSSIPPRERVEFQSGGETCVAWHYPSRNGVVIVMASGLAVTRSAGTDAYAKAFVDAGFGVLAFDFRHFGDSAGSPRQVAGINKMRCDLAAAINFARSLPDVDDDGIALWGFSLAGGLVIEAAAKTPGLFAVIAQSPLVDGRAAARHAMQHQSITAAVRLGMRALGDALGAMVGRAPRMAKLVGARGSVALLTTPDAGDAERALGPRHLHPEWREEVAARIVLALPSYRPGKLASSVTCPLLIVASSQDETVPIHSGRAVVERARAGESVEITGGHYAPFLERFDECVSAEIAFLRKHALPDMNLARQTDRTVRS